MNRSGYFAAAAVACVVLVAGSAAFAELTAEQTKQAQTLIKDFAAKEFTTRQAAVEKLIALGPDVVPLVKKVQGETADAEVKLRCQMTLKGITDKYGVTVTGPKAALKTSLEASKITMETTDAPLDEVMQKLSDESGNALIKVPGELADKTVTLKMKDATYWQVLDKVCEQVGAVYQPDFSSGKGGVTLVATAKANDLGGTNGPVSVKINSVSKTRMLRPWGPGQPLTNNLQCQLVFFWEDRIPVLSAEGQTTKATLPDGREVAQPAQPMGRMMVGMGGGRAQSFGNLFYQANDLGEGVNKLSTLEGTIKLTAGVGPDKEIKVDDVLSEGEKSGTADGVTLTVTHQGLGANNGNPDAAANLPIQVNIRATRDGEAVDVPIEQTGLKYGGFLIDPEGKRYTPMGFGFGGGWRGGPGRLKVVPAPGGNADGNAARTVTLTFFNVPKTEGKWSLLVVYPGDTVTKEYPFVIKDVPLP